MSSEDRAHDDIEEKPADDADDSSSESSAEESEEVMARMAAALKAMGLSGSGAQNNTQEPIISSPDLNGIAQYIKENHCRNIIVMAGAGISTAAGIPDFRTPGTGLYDNLQAYKLPHPTAVFELDYFKSNPQPFYKLAKELYPDNFKPTLSHYFIKLLEKHGMLLRHFTQNIDMLERKAGVSGDKLVEAHGSFATAHCVQCKAEADTELIRLSIMKDEIPHCKTCNCLVKPDIVFFGENLPERFGQLMASDFPKCDLLIIMGTSLAVQPFASLVNQVPEDVPRLLINRDKVGAVNKFYAMLGLASGMDYDSGVRDVAWLGACDDGCVELATLLGLRDELIALHAEGHAEQ